MMRAAFLAALAAAALMQPALAAPGPAAASVSGQVLETAQASGCSCLRLKTASGEVWAAVPAATVAKGAQVTIVRLMAMENFESRSLGRSFDRILFGELADPQAKKPKAEGPEGRTVAEVVSGKARLKDKTAAVRGQPVRINSGILGKNWVHIQDGSGSAVGGSNDLLVTTQDQPALGDIVNACGTVRTDVDVGSGHRCAVLVEGAVLRK